MHVDQTCRLPSRTLYPWGGGSALVDRLVERQRHTEPCLVSLCRTGTGRSHIEPLATPSSPFSGQPEAGYGSSPQSSPGRVSVGGLRFAIIGAGRLGTSLALALEQRGAQLVGFVCRTEQGTRQAEHLLGRPATGGLASLVSAQPSAIFLTVPDDALCRVVQELAAHLGCTHPLPAGIVVHTSGATSVRVLAPCAAVGWSALAFHPLQTFPSLLPEGTPGEAELQTPLSSAQQAALAAEASKRFLGIGVAVTPFPDQAETAR
ncbi:MAG: NAD(P)-binding domain-containing protein, partial [Thermoleophilia bacterium]|nr:NAD(P)-binding domain-containing protein [Thermoleophilia bacterium]